MRSTPAHRFFSPFKVSVTVLVLCLGLLGCAEKGGPAPHDPNESSDHSPEKTPDKAPEKTPEKAPEEKKEETTRLKPKVPGAPTIPPQKGKPPLKHPVTTPPLPANPVPPVSGQPSLSDPKPPGPATGGDQPPVDPKTGAPAPEPVEPPTPVNPKEFDLNPAPNPIPDLDPNPVTDSVAAPAPPNPNPAAEPKTPPKPIESFADIQDEAATEESLRDLFNLPAERLNTDIDVRAGSGDRSEKFEATFWLLKTRGFKEGYQRLSDLEKARFFNFYSDDVETLFRDYFKKGDLDHSDSSGSSSGSVEQKVRLKRYLQALFFHGQCNDLPTDGNGYSDKDSPFKTWGANFILPKIISSSAIDRIKPTAGRFFQKELFGKITLDDLETGIKEYFNKAHVKRNLLENASELKKEAARQSEPELRFEQVMIFNNRTQSAPALGQQKSGNKMKAQQILKDAYQNLAQLEQDDPKWANAVATYMKFLNEDQTGFVIFPFEDAYHKPLVLFKTKVHSAATPSKSQSRRAPPQTLMVGPKPQAQITTRSPWVYIFEYVLGADTLKEFIEKLQARKLEERTLYLWKGGNDVDKLLVALHFPETPQPEEADVHLLVGQKGSANGADALALENLRKGDLPHPSTLLDLRTFAHKFR